MTWEHDQPTEGREPDATPQTRGDAFRALLYKWRSEGDPEDADALLAAWRDRDADTHETQATISAWAEQTFGPVSGNLAIGIRALEEFAELLSKLAANDAHPGAMEEIADVHIVLARLAHRLGGDTQQAVDDKMATNRARVWRLDGKGQGQHVELAATRKQWAGESEITEPMELDSEYALEPGDRVRLDPDMYYRVIRGDFAVYAFRVIVPPSPTGEARGYQSHFHLYDPPMLVVVRTLADTPRNGGAGC